MNTPSLSIGTTPFITNQITRVTIFLNYYWIFYLCIYSYKLYITNISFINIHIRFGNKIMTYSKFTYHLNEIVYVPKKLLRIKTCYAL